MIQMTNGYTCYMKELYCSKDGPVSMSEIVEARLIAKGVAVSVEGDDPVETKLTGGLKTEVKPEEGETNDEPKDEPDLLNDMSFDELKALASEMGIDTKGMRSKASVIEAIEAAKPPDVKVIE